ncbi:Alpha/Beta hydrolase protein [Mycotypha africana]|uniref:Alpha/Beta hydrolase protein n=1 Tax=Mycotypha africana TaxID=64632 RepID=UPI00230192F0|nr:Alpha/Beta hydrolase protein [Mycotypha africana]KAI8975486.1 Alpha/Beta hydrolase protein [Mycotypha africana]
MIINTLEISLKDLFSLFAILCVEKKRKITRMASYSKACCELPPVVSDYEKTGEMEKYDGLDIYTVGPKDAKKAVLVIYDIFGYHPNAYQFCDILAKSCKWRVIMPDLLHGDYATMELLGKGKELMAWLDRVGTLEVVTPDIQRSEKYLKEAGVDACTLVGFCWGAKIAVQLTSLNPFFVGASLIHPSFVDVKDAEKAGAPILAIPSKDEPDMTEYMEVLYKKPFGKQCKHVRFDDMQHGFCAARGDYNDKLNAQRANEAIRLTADFYTECFNAPASSL